MIRRLAYVGAHAPVVDYVTKVSKTWPPPLKLVLQPQERNQQDIVL